MFFFQSQFLCDVNWAFIDRLKMMENKSTYIIDKVKNADFIILVHSYGAYEKYRVSVSIKIQRYRYR